MKATGTFTWDRCERVTDRYGSFNLYDGTRDGTLKPCKARVTARVLETRESDHVGDIFRGFSPSRPDVGEEIELGVAMVRVERKRDEEGQMYTKITMAPDDGRETDWIDPAKLYRLHAQTVEVTVDPVA